MESSPLVFRRTDRLEKIFSRIATMPQASIDDASVKQLTLRLLRPLRVSCGRPTFLLSERFQKSFRNRRDERWPPARNRKRQFKRHSQHFQASAIGCRLRTGQRQRINLRHRPAQTSSSGSSSFNLAPGPPPPQRAHCTFSPA